MIAPAKSPAEPSLLLTDVQVGALLAVSRRKVWYLVSNKQLPPPVHIGRHARWERQAIVDYVDRLCEESRG